MVLWIMIIIDQYPEKSVLFLNFFYNSAHCESEHGGQVVKKPRIREFEVEDYQWVCGHDLMTQPFQKKTRMQEPPISGGF